MNADVLEALVSHVLLCLHSVEFRSWQAYVLALLMLWHLGNWYVEGHDSI